jgi:hypothetical protein
MKLGFLQPVLDAFRPKPPTSILGRYVDPTPAPQVSNSATKHAHASTLPNPFTPAELSLLKPTLLPAQCYARRTGHNYYEPATVTNITTPNPHSVYTVVWAHGDSYTGFESDFEVALTPEQVELQSTDDINEAHLPLTCFATRYAVERVCYEPSTLIKIQREKEGEVRPNDMFTFRWSDGSERSDYARQFKVAFKPLPKINKPFDPFEL